MISVCIYFDSAKEQLKAVLSFFQITETGFMQDLISVISSRPF